MWWRWTVWVWMFDVFYLVFKNRAGWLCKSEMPVVFVRVVWVIYAIHVGIFVSVSILNRFLFCELFIFYAWTVPLSLLVLCCSLLWPGRMEFHSAFSLLWHSNLGISTKRSFMTKFGQSPVAKTFSLFILQSRHKVSELLERVPTLMSKHLLSTSRQWWQAEWQAASYYWQYL